MWIKGCQEELKNDKSYQDQTSKLKLEDQGGVLKCRGRLENSDLDMEAQQPIILAKDHRLTKLLIEECHRKVHHGGVRATLGELRSRFWVPKGRQVVKKVLRECVTCKKEQCKPFEAPPTAALPGFRVRESPPFSKASAKLVKRLCDSDEMKEHLESNRIDWKFNLEKTPWWGGFYERLIGTAKRCLRKVLGNAKLNANELLTVLTEVEATMNSRPLAYEYDELGAEMLTPSHLIYGRRLLSFFRRGECDNKVSAGEVVLVHEDNGKRSNWKMGKVEELIVGKDKEVRGVKLRVITKGKPIFVNRPVQKLYPLEVCGIENGDRGNPVNQGSVDLGGNPNKETEGREN
ncbi:hypothetical protein ACROYT_G037352 [Oculina patagonica]